LQALFPGFTSDSDSLFRDRRIDRCFLLGYSLMLKEGDPACSMPIHSTPACDPGITWTIGKCLGRFVLKVCLHLACLVILFEDTEIQGLWSGFHEPESSLAHVEMIWHCWYHPNTVERSVRRVFTCATMQHSRGKAHALKKSYTCHPRFSTHFACHNVFTSAGWRILCVCFYVFVFAFLSFVALSVHVFFSFLSL
jgi:hypothetical protein